MGHAALAALPAQEDDPIALEGVEVDQSPIEVLHHASLRMNPAHGLGDRVAQVLGSVLERLAWRGGRLRRLEIPIRIGVIEHATEGIVLFDAGSAPRTFELAPWSRSVCTCDATAAQQLAGLGIAASDVRHVIASHLHLDHVGGLRDFPEAAIHVHREAWNHAFHTSRLALAVRGRRMPAPRFSTRTPLSS